jgi:hypothetical protein
MARKQDSAPTQRVVLPGGYAIEMTPHAQSSRERGDGQQKERTGLDELHVCPDCSCELVQPTDWEPVGRDRWRVDLRCPECEWRGLGVHDQRTMDRFDEVLDDGTESLLADLTELSRAIMEEEVDHFVDALRRDLVLPEDF